jgi:hypothetical protein
MQRKHGILEAASLLLVGCTLLFGACGGGGSGGGSGGSGTLDLNVTDAPFEFDIVAAASIAVDKITIFHEADGDAGPIVLYQGTPIVIDLFKLHDGISQDLDNSTLPVGLYRQLRLRVTHAELTLTNGNHYTTNDDTIQLTSQGTSGFKVFVDPPIQIQDGQTRNVLLDFDLTHTFQPVPGNDALTATFYHLHPVIHVQNLGNTGGIHGTVTQDDGLGGLVPVNLATIYVLPPGQTDTSLAVATTGTNLVGSYTVLAIAPGAYDVLAVKGPLSALATGVTVVTGDIAVVNLTLADATGSLGGTVSMDNGSGGLAPVAAANVFVLPLGLTDTSLAIASGITALNGTYLVSGIPAGTYDVRAIQGALSALAPGVVIVAGANPPLNLTIH